MKWRMLALTIVLLACARPAEVAASRCFDHSSEFHLRAVTCSGAPTSSLPFEGRIPVAYGNRDDADAYFNRARAYFDKGLYDLAIADYDAAIRLQPDAASAYVNRGNAHAGTGRYGRALTDYDTAIRLDPDLASAYINRGIVSAKQDLLEWALRDFGRAYDLDVRPTWMVETLQRHGRLP